MHLVPTQEEVVSMLRKTGAIRDGHFEYPNGLHSTQYMQVQLAMRYFQDAKILSVGLSRLLRANRRRREEQKHRARQPAKCCRAYFHAEYFSTNGCHFFCDRKISSTASRTAPRPPKFFVT